MRSISNIASCRPGRILWKGDARYQLVGTHGSLTNQKQNCVAHRLKCCHGSDDKCGDYLTRQRLGPVGIVLRRTEHERSAERAKKPEMFLCLIDRGFIMGRRDGKQGNNLASHRCPILIHSRQTTSSGRMPNIKITRGKGRREGWERGCSRLSDGSPRGRISFVWWLRKGITIHHRRRRLMDENSEMRAPFRDFAPSWVVVAQSFCNDDANYLFCCHLGRSSRLPSESDSTVAAWTPK